MEPIDTAVLEQPEAEAVAAQPDASAESASQPTSDAQQSAAMNALLRGGLQVDGSTSNPDATDLDTADADAGPGVSAPTGDVKPGDARAPGRRGAAAEIARLKAENERLQAAYDAANPPPPDASEETRKAILEREQRYRGLAAKPWEDSDWTQDDIDFFQDEQKRRAVAPELRQHYETVLEADRKAWSTWAEQSIQQRWDAVKADLSTTLALPGVTPEIKAQLIEASLSEQVLTHRRLEREIADREIRKLREELSEARRDLFGSTRAPLGGGQSSAGRTYDENTYMNNLLRGGRS